MTDGDPHNRKTRIQNTLKSIEESEKITEHNKDVALDFKNFLEGQGLSLDRISRYLYSLKKIIEEIEWKLDNPSKDRLIDLVGDINQSKYWEDDLAEGTKAEYKKLIRKLYKDYLDSKQKDFDGEELTDFFSVTVQKNYADPDELPRPQHVASLVRQCRRPRDSSFIMLLWASAGRISSVLGVRYRDLRFHEDIAFVKFRDTKTGDDRKVPVASAFPYLKRRKERDPLGDNPDAFVFRRINSNDPEDQLSYNAGRGIIERARNNANIPNRIRSNPHSFRKGRISDLARKGFSEAQISRVSGHIVGSSEIRVYCRLASSDVTSSIRREAGLEIADEEENKDPLRPKKCPNDSCNHLNKWENENCSVCGEVLEEADLFKEIKAQETEKELQEQIVEKETSWDIEEIRKNAENLVERQIDESS